MIDDAPQSLGSFQSPVTALVVGASRGIGLGFVKHLLADACVSRVFAACRNPRAAEDLAALANADEERLRVLALDITDQSSVAAAANEMQRKVDRLDLLVNCAGVLHGDGSFSPERRLADVEPENLLHSFEVHAVGAALLGKYFARFFDRKSRAVFASLSARVGSIGDNRLGGWYSYRASKAAHNMILKNLSIELRRRCRGLICLALHPGTVDTDLSRPFQEGVLDGRLFPVERAVRQLISVIDGVGTNGNGGFFAWDGQTIPW